MRHSIMIFMPSAIMLSFAIMSIMLCVVMMSDVMMNVMAPSLIVDPSKVITYSRCDRNENDETKA